MERLKLTRWILDADKESTSYFYTHALETCGCLYCKNFADVILEKRTLFRKKLLELGIDATTPNHVSYFEREQEGGYLAMGNYHFSGRLVEGEWSAMDDWDDSNTAVLDGIRIGLSKEMELLPENFPEPVIQLNFEMVMPWIRKESPEED